MPNKNPEEIRKKLYEDYEDSLFKLVMHDVAEKEGRAFLEEKEKLKNNPEYTPSEEAVQRFSARLDVILNKKKAYAKKQRVLKVLRRSAVAALIVIVLLATTVASVEALRIRVLNFLMEIKPEYTSFQIKEGDNASGSGSPVVGWSKAYVPTYIPEGYKVSNSSNNAAYKRIIFENQEGLSIIYREINDVTTFNLDTENASVVKETSINGHKGTLAVKNSLVSVVWEMDGHVFTVQASTDEDTAVKIAEGVKFIY